ncbi:MAG: complex I subunit 5 family protein, partial [Candidatus Competibacterales bacterium]
MIPFLDWPSFNQLLPLLPLVATTFTALTLFGLDEDHRQLRTGLNLAGAGLNLLFVAIMLWGIYHQQSYGVSLSLGAGLALTLRPDTLSMFFTALSALLWLITTVYAVGYLADSPQRRRFFGFFGLCVTATMGLAMAGNLFTFFVFYEMLTLVTYPLVVHRGDAASLRAGGIYLRYTLGGGALLLVGLVALHALVGPQAFREGGFVGELAVEQPVVATVIFWLLIIGCGVKAALFPLHGWLPTAMVAPAPVSALLHAVAVVKAGAFGITRVVFEVFGAEAVSNLGVDVWLATLAAITILYGSWCALGQQDIKRRLAYSTVSQVSYITLGVALAGPLGAVGGIVHLVHQGLMKITLFFCAGNYATALGIKRVDQLDGVGLRMPLTTAAFTLGAFGMIGAPPLAGFVSKWYLGLGSLEAQQPWLLVVLALSTLLNAAYFLPLVGRVWFAPPPSPVAAVPASGPRH